MTDSPIGQVSQDRESVTRIFDANFEEELFCHSYPYLKIAESNVYARPNVCLCRIQINYEADVLISDGFTLT